jgi:hypothetical protein
MTMVWTEEMKKKMVETRRANKEKKKANGHAEYVSEVRRDAVMARWESVQQEQDNWLKPFYELPIDRAMRYLEDLRIIASKAGAIMNSRINEGKEVRCSGPHCAKNLTGLSPNGLPKWIKKMDFHDKDHPEIWHCLYFCSELCANGYTRLHMGALGGDGK